MHDFHTRTTFPPGLRSVCVCGWVRYNVLLSAGKRFCVTQQAEDWVTPRQRMVVVTMIRTTDRMRGDVMSVSMLTMTTATAMMLAQ